MRRATRFVLLMAMASPAVALSRPPSPGPAVGRTMQAFQLPDFRGKEHTLDEFREHRLLVVAFLGTECPLARRYGTRLATLASEFADQGVGFLGINSNRQDSIAEIAAYARRHAIEFPILKDLGHRVADDLGATRTPQVFLLDADRVVRYQGRIDDQYGIGYVRDQPQHRDLATAITQLLDRQPVSQPVTEPVGCLIGRTRKQIADAEVTYSNQVARILQNRCVECHRDGEIAPFSLTHYDDVVGWAPMIEEVVREGRMPPWHASEEHGSFVNERRLTEDEKQTIAAWVAAGGPEGDPADLPESREWVTGWQLPREPDFVAPITKTPYRVPAEGAVEYQYFRIDPEFSEDKWIKAVEIQPGNRAVVHHVLMFAGSARDIGDRFRGGARGYDGVYVPGQRVMPYPAGTAKRIPAGSHLFFQVHYTPIGTEQFDQSRVGLLFADPQDVQHEVVTASAVNFRLRIPPGDGNHRVEADSRPLPENARLVSLMPHMHLRGKSFVYEAVLEDGQRISLLDVPRYDFNWQTAYRLSEPMALPAGTEIHCVAHFDNSERNLNNPDPTVRVRWGEQTWDEMMIGYFDYVVPRGQAPASEPPRPRNQNRARRIFDRLDENGDGRLTIDEVPARYHEVFASIDQDGSKTVSFEEFGALLRGRR